MNTLYTILTTQYSSLIERNYSSIAKRESTPTSTNTSIVTGMALILLIVASVFTASANANSKENRLALGNTVLRLISYHVVNSAFFIEQIPPGQIVPISAGDIECTNSNCEVHIRYPDNCTQDLQLSPSGAGKFHSSGEINCDGVLLSGDANMSVWTPGVGADALSNDHPVSVVSLANFVRRDNSNTETQYERRSVVKVNSGKKKGKKTMTLSGGAITVNKSNLDVITDECIVKMRDMRDAVRVEASCIILPKISSATNTQPVVAVNFEVDFPIFSVEEAEVVRSSSGKMTVTRINLIPGIN